MTKQTKLLAIAKQVQACTHCPLYKTALQGVPGAGNTDARVVFVGEAPGANEDKNGVPFCGRAGTLLDFLLKGINLPRETIFITNIVKHRPPQNRDPLPAELGACSPYLEKQLAIISPELVVTLGRFSLNYFLPAVYISHVHGQIQFPNWQGQNFVLMPLYHPAAALRNGAIAKELEKDFIKLGLYLQTIRKKHN